MSEWIPCKEQLPPVFYDTLGNWSSEPCLVYMPNAEGECFALGVFNPVGVFEWGMYGDFVGNVSNPEDEYYVAAWMPLPEPYREDKE